MADKSFGVKNVNLIGSSGTPTIESPNNVNINAINVAISTDATIGGDLTVTGSIVGIASTSSATIVNGASTISDPNGSGNAICMVPTGHSPGTATTIYRDTGIRFRDSDVTLLIGDGNPGNGQMNVGGIATAGSFVKSGGTSSQFLMADGSVSVGAGSTTSGSIVQYLRFVHTGMASTNTTSYQPTGLTGSITPRLANSKIVVAFEHSIYHAGQQSNQYSLHGIRIMRGNTAVYTPVTNTGGPYDFGIFNTSQSITENYYGRSRVEYMDTPSYTLGQSITYSTEISCYDNDGTVYSNFIDPTPGAQIVNPQSWITLMEVSN